MSRLPLKCFRLMRIHLQRSLWNLRRPRAVELAGVLCVIFGVAKALCYGRMCSVLFHTPHLGAGPVDSTLDLWRIGVAVELVGCMLVCVWMTDPPRNSAAATRAGVDPAQRSAALLLLVQVFVLGYSVVAGAWGVFQWGTGLCIAACLGALQHVGRVARRSLRSP